MKKLLILFFVFTVAQAAFPVDVRLTWTDPVEYVDGTPLDADAELIAYEAYCEKNSLEVMRDTWQKVAGVTVRDFPGAFDGAGTYICFLRVQAINLQWSDYSDPATKKVTGKPGKPIIIDFEATRS